MQEQKMSAQAQLAEKISNIFENAQNRAEEIEHMSPEEAEAYWEGCEKQSEAMYMAGYHCYVSGKYEEALRLFEMPLLLSPMNIECLLGCAYSYKRMHNIEKALAYFNTITFITEGKIPSVSIAMAEIFLTLKDHKRAQQCLELAQKSFDEGNEKIFDIDQKIFRGRLKVLKDSLEKRQDT